MERKKKQQTDKSIGLILYYMIELIDLNLIFQMCEYGKRDISRTNYYLCHKTGAFFSGGCGIFESHRLFV